MFGERWIQDGAEASTSETAREPPVERRDVRYLQTHRLLTSPAGWKGISVVRAASVKAQVNHAGKAYRAPGSFSTAEDAARAYDKLVRTLGLTAPSGCFRRTTASARTCDPTRRRGKEDEREEGEEDPIVAP